MFRATRPLVGLYLLSKLPKTNANLNRFRRVLYSSYTSAAAKDDTTGFHSIIRDTEKAKGDAANYEFKAETKMLLDIVARSLYSENEVFVREIVSNASDALEKFRYTINTAGESVSTFQEIDRKLEIHIQTNKQDRTLTIQDTGIGMNKDELLNNIGTIAKSGSKEFLQKVKDGMANADNISNIIGQFGVGFYSAFMVADKVDVYTKSAQTDGIGYKWSSDGSGTYTIQESDGVAPGTKIVIHLKNECREYSDENRIRDVIKKYSNFVGFPIYLNGLQVNQIQPLWLMDPKEVTPEQHTEFYRFVSNSFDIPRYTLHYKTDVPLSIRALLYIPEGKPGLFEMSRDSSTGVSLYTRKVLIQSKTEVLLPKWLRFIKGVVDSEDIPLNLSRELLQNSALIRKLQSVLTTRVLKLLLDKSNKEPVEYDKFYKDYGMFLKEGIVTSTDQHEKESIAKLLRFESSKCKEGDKVTIEDYLKNLKENQKDIYYLAAPSRALAEQSPYFESLKKKDIEVLFCYEPYDELVLMQLLNFKSHPLTSVEKEMRREDTTDEKEIVGSDGTTIDSLNKSEIDDLSKFIKDKLAGKVFNVKTTNKLQNHPCVVTVEEMAAARHFIKTQSHQLTEENRYALLQSQLEINPKHPIIKKLSKLTKSDPELASLLVQQLFSNSMVGAGLVDDPRILLSQMNSLLERVLEKY